jgi:flagellar hook protein FlgE
MLQSTGRDTDLAIQGDGFFIYNRDGTQFYSRDGSLAMDAEGYLVNANTGMRIQGWQAVTSGSSAMVDPGTPIGQIQLPLGSSLSRATTDAALSGNLQSTTTTGSAGEYNATLGLYDSLGALHSTKVTFTRTGDDTWTWQASGANASGSGALTFDQSGQYLSGSGSIAITGTGGAANQTVALDLSGLTQLATESDVSITAQDGLGAGNFTGFYVANESGAIYGVYSNGMQQMIGQVALASFVNPGGLSRAGQNIFEVGPNSGNPSIGTAGTGGRGSVVPGNLEASNVDLGQEFTNMILAQRGFQASSRIITTSDEMLQELVNLKR